MSVETLTNGMIHASEIIFFLSGIFGMITHYFKKSMKKETESMFSEWFGKKNIKATITTFGMFFMAMVGALGAGVITPEMNIYAIMYSGFATGFAIDSGFNSDMTKTIVDTKKQIQDLNSKE